MEEAFIDFDSTKNESYFNPRLPSEIFGRLEQLAKSFPKITSHVFLNTSGATNTPKLVLLSKEAFLVSAKAVNEMLQASASDRWLIPLPLFHVGGLSITARCHLSKSKFSILNPWNPRAFCAACIHDEVTLSSLVPTQLYDLLSLDLVCPSSLRAVIIGGGKLSERLFRRARELRWPVLPSFGMTEACSQVATAMPDSLNQDSFPPLMLLPHLNATTDDEGKLSLRGASLLSGYAEYRDGEPYFYDPKTDGVFVTEDLVKLEKGEKGIKLIPEGRQQDAIKISGELVFLSELNSKLSDLLQQHAIDHKAVLIKGSDARLENKVVLVGSLEDSKLLWIKDELTKIFLPVARPREVYRVSELPRTPLGKVVLTDLLSSLQKGDAQKIYP